MGQLDGGHIAYSVLGPTAARRLSVAVVLLLVGGGFVMGSHLLMWGLVVWLIAGLGHPPAADDSTPSGRGRGLLALLSAVLLLAILLPIPQ